MRFNKRFGKIILFLLLISPTPAQDWVKFTKSKILFKEVPDEVMDSSVLKKFDGFLTMNKYCIAEVFPSIDTASAKFIVNGQIFFTKDSFGKISTWDLDLGSLQMYVGEFSQRQYLLVTGTNSGSGMYAVVILFNLFDVTDSLNVRYYPLWSLYGDESCLGDFNKDGLLDFLKIRNWIDDRQHRIKLSYESLQGSSFQDLDKGEHYIIGDIIPREPFFRVVRKKW